MNPDPPLNVARRLARLETADRRLRNILRTSVGANDRMLEQKISDAGPTDQRIDPHVLTLARRHLIHNGSIMEVTLSRVPWFFLSSADPARVEERLTVLAALQHQTQHNPFILHVGQALEIAVFRALLAQDTLAFFGAFRDLAAHDDSTLYKKVEPPSYLSGRDCGTKNLDFIVHLPSVTYAGLEVKNVRQWMYPSRDEIKAFLSKCCALDIVLVLIARRIHYSAFSVLNPCGVLIHQTFNQLYPQSAADLALQVKNKHLLGFHDVRLGNEPDQRLLRFIHVNLPLLLPEARVKFDTFKDLLAAYARGDHSYKSFAARVKRRLRGEPEDLPPLQPEEPVEHEEYDNQHEHEVLEQESSYTDIDTYDYYPDRDDNE